MTGKKIILSLLVLLSIFGCTRRGILEPDRPTLAIRLLFSNQNIITKGYTGDIAADRPAENTISRLQVWVFRSSDAASAAPIGYLDISGSALSDGTEKNYLMALDKSFVDNPGNVDVYVLANAASAGVAPDGSATRTTLSGLQLGSGYFGAASPVKTVPSGGLPMSGVLLNATVSGSYPAWRVGSETELTTINLVRAVSKVRFILSKETGLDGISISDITLSSGQIPNNEYLFLPGPWPANMSRIEANNYSSSAISYSTNGAGRTLSVSEIADNAAPEDYSFASFSASGSYTDAQSYENFLNDAIEHSYVTEWDRTYLHESDKALTGTITYSVTDIEGVHNKVANFSMKTPGDFTRNSSWIVYAYFRDHALFIEYTVITAKDWIDEAEDIAF